MRPHVGISSCLLGERVRYDGNHKRKSLLIAVLSDHVVWVPVCPELELGMGVPREKVRLIVSPVDGERRMVGEASKRDWTHQMEQLAETRAVELTEDGVSGYIFKSRSPSCGLQRVKLYQGAGPPKRQGMGLFAAAVQLRLPRLPVIEETDLTTAQACQEFLKRVRAYQARDAAKD